jgi:hypothetical protein
MVEVSGWTRTLLLATGAFAGVLTVAGIIHVLKQKGVIS